MAKTKLKKKFVHLHGHSKYSPRDAYNTYTDILKYAQELGQPAVAVTDHYYMYNVSEFYFDSISKDKKEDSPNFGKLLYEDVKAIIGCELGVAPEGEINDAVDEYYFHLTALAMNETGKKNLMTLASLSTQRDDEHFYKNPRVLWKDFEKYNEGIIVLSGCLGSELNELLTVGKAKLAKKVAERYHKVFGDNYYIEIQDHGIPQQIKNNKKLIEIADELGIQLVLTNDYHYTDQDYAEVHGILVYGCQGKQYHGIGNKETKYYSSDDFYMKSDEEMWEIALKWDRPDMYENTIVIADKCEVVEFDTKKIKFPRAQLVTHDNADDEVRALAYNWLERKYPNPDKHIPISAWDDDGKEVPTEFLSPETPRERLERELVDISEAGYSDYFLIICDILKYAHDNDIMIGPGRGSAAGSILSTVLEITDICPLKYGLFFERFFNKGRVDSPPDIDIDFPPSRRQEVISYVVGKYGSDYVAQITTFSELGGRSALNTAGKAMGDSFIGARLGKLLHKKKDDIKWNLENTKDFKNEYKKNKLAQRTIDAAIEITGCLSSRSTHAAGLIISDLPLNEYIPTLANSGASGWTTQIEYKLLEKQRMLKADLLGLETLDVLQNTIWNIEFTQGKTISIKDIPEKDEATFKLFRAGDTKGIFQLEADWCNDRIRNANVRHFDTISALITLIRPGSLNSGMTETYLKCAQGLQDPKSIHTKLSYATKETFHTLIYQEQIMETAKALAGFDLLEADDLRKKISKAQKDDLELLREKFVKGCKSFSDISNKESNVIFDVIVKFGDYGFNKAHSVGYAKNSYFTGYFKANYFLEFMSALLTSNTGKFDKTAIYVDNVLEHGYEVMAPDINLSTHEFVPDIKNGAIRFPFGSVDSVGPAAVDAIIEERELNGNYTNFENFVARTPGKSVNKATIIALIVVGAFDSLGYSRKDLYDDCESIIADIRNQAKKIKAKGLGFGRDGKTIEELVEKTGNEFDHAEVMDDEVNYIGFAFSLTDKQKRERLISIKSKSKVNYDEVDSKSSNSSKPKEKRKSSALERLKKARGKETIIDVEDSEPVKSEVENKAELESIKDRLKGSLGKGSKKSIEPTVVSEDSDDEFLLVEVSIGDNIKVAKMLRIALKYKVETGTPLAFNVSTTDGSGYMLETGFCIDNPKRFVKLAEKIVGEGKSRITEREW